ncbi:MAG: hypothetical protein KDK91_32525 [Gammaproteobacteria bacterium]|nr:hypothetical protein [Gammaproteobacteria bacterium]
MKALSTTMAALAISITVAMPALAADEHNVSKGLTLAGAPLGLQGIDAVALSTIHDVAEGSAAHTVVIEGVAYYFASAASAETFTAAPDKYLPQFGGYCAYAVALGKKLDGDPRYADIVDGRLYLFVNEAIFHKYQADKANILRKAHSTWPAIQHKAVAAL